MKRLVVTGLPCPSDVWEDFLGSETEQRILPIREVFENTASSDPREMSRYITQEMEAYRPDAIVAHDLGVPLTLLSLLRLNRRGICTRTPVTLFNGAFRRVNLLRANHPFRLQLWSKNKAIRVVEKFGGQVDLSLEPFLPRIRSMYRVLIFFGLTEKIGNLVGLDDLVGFTDRGSITAPLQIIASANDPFIPWEAIEQLREDLQPQQFTRVDYGHFPYTQPREKFGNLVSSFEQDFGPTGKKPKLTVQPSRTLL